MAQFNVDDCVWVARTSGKQRDVVCPDCAGTCALTVILGDGSQVSIECETCRFGYHGPQGVTSTYDTYADVRCSVVSRVSTDSNGSNYSFSDLGCEDDCNVFATREDAMARACILVEEHGAAQDRRMQRKCQPMKTWAQNVSRHRSEIKRLTRELEYHTRCLAVAKAKAKSPEPEAEVL